MLLVHSQVQPARIADSVAVIVSAPERRRHGAAVLARDHYLCLVVAVLGVGEAVVVSGTLCAPLGASCAVALAGSTAGSRGQCLVSAVSADCAGAGRPFEIHWPSGSPSLEIQSACIAHHLAVESPAPQRRLGGVTVRTDLFFSRLGPLNALVHRYRRGHIGAEGWVVRGKRLGVRCPGRLWGGFAVRILVRVLA